MNERRHVVPLGKVSDLLLPPERRSSKDPVIEKIRHTESGNWEYLLSTQNYTFLRDVVKSRIVLTKEGKQRLRAVKSSFDTYQSERLDLAGSDGEKYLIQFFPEFAAGAAEQVFFEKKLCLRAGQHTLLGWELLELHQQLQPLFQKHHCNLATPLVATDLSLYSDFIVGETMYDVLFESYTARVRKEKSKATADKYIAEVVAACSETLLPLDMAVTRFFEDEAFSHLGWQLQRAGNSDHNISVELSRQDEGFKHTLFALPDFLPQRTSQGKIKLSRLTNWILPFEHLMEVKSALEASPQEIAAVLLQRTVCVDPFIIRYRREKVAE